MYATSEEVERLVAGFVDCSLPREAWTHDAHLAVAVWHLRRHGAAETLNLVRARIQRFNVAKGGQNTPSSGYHETLTRFYLWAVARSLEGMPPEADLIEQVNHVIRECDRELPRRYYSEERLMSAEARKGWVPPDRQPMS